MDNIVLTEKGLALRDKLNAGQTTATFTRFCTSSAEYDQSELGALTELKDSKLESAVTNLEIREDHTMVISGAVDNKSLQEGYYITLIGLYAKETDGEEILFAASKVSSPMYMPEKSGALSGMSIRFSIKIENADSVDVTVDPTTAATLGDLNVLKKEVLTPTFEDYEAKEAPALPTVEDAMKQIKSGNTMRVILQNTKAAFRGLLNLVNAKVNQKDYDTTVNKLNGDITTLTKENELLKKYPIMVTWNGQFAYDSTVISSPAWARCIKYANGKCDIHIDTMIETNKATGSFYKIWNRARILSGFGINTLSFKPYQTRVSVDFPNMGNHLFVKDAKTGSVTLAGKQISKWIDESNFPSVSGYKRLGMLNAQANDSTEIIVYPNGYMGNTSSDARNFSVTSRWLYENKLVGGTQEHFGRTGLAFQSEADFFLLSRAYAADLQTFGGWGIEAAPLYAVGTVHHIDIWGADYT